MAESLNQTVRNHSYVWTGLQVSLISVIRIEVVSFEV